MPARKEYTAKFKEQAFRFVLEEIESDESCEHASDRFAPKPSVKARTLYNWYAPGPAHPAVAPDSIEEFLAQKAALLKENLELARAKAVLQDAAALFGAALDRQEK